jgi:ABC-type Fe3+-siderophore transport system permease subunit
MKTTAKAIAGCIALLAILLLTTQPNKLPSAVLILPFAIMFAILALLVALAIGWRHGGMSLKAFRGGAVGAVLPILLVLLQSVGQLTLRDACMLFALFGITHFYMSKVNGRSTPGA